MIVIRYCIKILSAVISTVYLKAQTVILKNNIKYFLDFMLKFFEVLISFFLFCRICSAEIVAECWSWIPVPPLPPHSTSMRTKLSGT